MPTTRNYNRNNNDIFSCNDDGDPKVEAGNNEDLM